MTSEWARKKAESVCKEWEEMRPYGWVPAPLQDLVAAALDEARREGAERERWASHHEALDTIDDMIEQSSYKAMEGMRWVVSRIAARGPMRGPEEEEE